MKKKILVLICCVLFTTYGFSQDRGYVGLSVGMSNPISDFASVDAKNNAAGFAKMGHLFDLSFAYKLGRNLGVAATLRKQSNDFDGDALASAYSAQYPGTKFSVISDAWTISGFMFGAYGSSPFSKYASFEIKALIGFLNTSQPGIVINGTSSNGIAFVKIQEASATSIAYLFSGGFKFNVGSKICLITGLEYITTKPEFVNVLETASNGKSMIETYTQSLGTINFVIGLGYRL